VLCKKLFLMSSDCSVMKAQQAGVSLVECMVVLAVLGIACAVAAVDLPELRERRVIRTEAESIKLVLEQAAMLAVASMQGVDAEITKNAISLKYQGGTSILVRHLPLSLRLISQGESRHLLTFYPTVSATPATFVLKSRTLSCSIVVSLRTRITVIC
jgi:prepilin-type N-terminal cleavage/methylation domain-containing protein